MSTLPFIPPQCPPRSPSLCSPCTHCRSDMRSTSRWPSAPCRTPRRCWGFCASPSSPTWDTPWWAEDSPTWGRSFRREYTRHSEGNHWKILPVNVHRRWPCQGRRAIVSGRWQWRGVPWRASGREWWPPVGCRWHPGPCRNIGYFDRCSWSAPPVISCVLEPPSW